MNRSACVALFLAGIMLACGEDPTPKLHTTQPNDYLVSVDSIRSFTSTELQALAKISGQDAVADLIKYDVTTFKIEYLTTYNGKQINASGLLYVPRNLTNPAPLLSLQHGTTFVKAKAPSTSGSFTGMEYFGAAGYISIMPDFIGYGASAELFHPYYDKKHSAQTVIDMIKSSKEFLEAKHISFNDLLFLAGYSEGGYVTLAVAEEIETNPELNLSLTAVAAGAGGYDLNEMLNNITSSADYQYPSYLAFVLMSYNTTYNWNKPLTYFFQEKYAAALEQYMNGDYDGGEINSHLTTQINALLNPEFLVRLKNSEGELELKAALKKNTISGWSTHSPIRLYHGTSDEIIPYQNSELTFENFKRAGATVITLTLIDGEDHGSSFIPMVQDFVPWFETLRID